MSENYLKQYKIAELFDKNDYQEIHMATDRLDAEAVVVINTLKKNNIIQDSFLEEVRKALKSLVYSEASESSITLITKYCNGEPLEAWLKNNALNPDQIKSYITQYLTHISSYDLLDSHFHPMLTDASQIVLHDQKICMSEMIFLDEHLLSTESVPFSEVLTHVATVLNLFIGAAAEPYHADVVAIRNFVKNELSSASNLSALSPLWDAVNSPVEQITRIAPVEQIAPTEQALATEPVVPVEPSEPKHETEHPHVVHPPHHAPFHLEENDNATLVELDTLREKKDPAALKRMGLIAVAVVAVVAVAAFFLVPKLLSSNAQPPTASYTWFKHTDGVLKFINTSKVFGKNNAVTDSEWKVFSGDKEIFSSTSFDLSIALKSSGTYKVTLRVKDKNKNWSKPYSESLYYETTSLVPLKDSGISSGEETLDNQKIKFDTANIFWDDKVFNTGNKSIRMELGKKGKATLTLSELKAPKDYVVSFWMKAAQQGQYEFTLVGKKNGVSKFTKYIVVTPDSVDAWQMTEFRVDNTPIDALSITAKGSGNLWLDDFQIGVIK